MVGRPRHAGYAGRFRAPWYARAARSRVEPLKVFARELTGYRPGILSPCRCPLTTTSVPEGIDNETEVVTRIAYGFRDDAALFLQIRAAFPGDGR